MHNDCHGLNSAVFVKGSIKWFLSLSWLDVTDKPKIRERGKCPIQSLRHSEVIRKFKLHQRAITYVPDVHKVFDSLIGKQSQELEVHERIFPASESEGYA